MLLLLMVIRSLNAAMAQQTVQLSQYTFNGLAVNPAYSGYTEQWMIRGAYRTQWTGIAGAPRTGTVSLDGTLDAAKNLGVGLLLMNDRVGPQQTTSAWLNYAYRIKLDEADTRRLSFGMAAGVSQYRVDAAGFMPTDILDQNLPVADQTDLIPDLRGGVYYCSSSFYAGFSGLNLLGSRTFSGTNAIRLERHYYLTAGALLSLNSTFDLKPSLLVKDDLKGPTNIDVSNYVAIRRTVWVGASYRFGKQLWGSGNIGGDVSAQDAVSLLGQVFLKERYRLGYSFDFAAGRFAGAQNGTHEISLSIALRAKKERLLSPRFF